jgi:hypothetical protein
MDFSASSGPFSTSSVSFFTFLPNPFCSTRTKKFFEWPTRQSHGTLCCKPGLGPKVPKELKYCRIFWCHDKWIAMVKPFDTSRRLGQQEKLLAAGRSHVQPSERVAAAATNSWCFANIGRMLFEVKLIVNCQIRQPQGVFGAHQIFVL